MKKHRREVPGIMMVDGEKAGLESSVQRNKHRKEGTSTRRRVGRKLDLMARNFKRKEDWLIIESMRSWDPVSPSS
jgi:hypothetical protein